MTTPVANIIADAFRETNLIPVGTAPTIAEQAEALTKLNAYIFTTLGFGLGEELFDWLVPAPQRTAPVEANFPQLPYPLNGDPEFVDFPANGSPDITVWQYPPKNSRIIWGQVTATAFFPEQPEPGSRMALVQGSGAGDGGTAGQILTLDGNGRTINGANTQTFTAPLASAAMWVYREDLADWQPVAALLLSDNMPFPPSTDDYFAMALAIRMAPRYGKTISPETAAAYKRADTAFRAKFKQSGTTVYGASDFPRSLQAYISGRRYW